jgi:hypothetical protein
MLNPWLAITFQAIRLGFEAQNAVALRMMRLVGDVSKTAAGGMIADKAPRRQMLKRLRKKLRHVLAEGVRPSPKSTKNACAPRGPGTLITSNSLGQKILPSDTAQTVSLEMATRAIAVQKSPRCTATSKRTGEGCGAPAVPGWSQKRRLTSSDEPPSIATRAPGA